MFLYGIENLVVGVFRGESSAFIAFARAHIYEIYLLKYKTIYRVVDGKNAYGTASGGNYTDPVFLRDDPEVAVRALDRVLTHYPPDEIAGETVWLDQWQE